MEANLAGGEEEDAIVCCRDVCGAGDGKADYEALVEGVDCEGAEGGGGWKGEGEGDVDEAVGEGVEEDGREGVGGGDG